MMTICLMCYYKSPWIKKHWGKWMVAMIWTNSDQFLSESIAWCITQGGAGAEQERDPAFLTLGLCVRMFVRKLKRQCRDKAVLSLLIALINTRLLYISQLLRPVKKSLRKQIKEKERILRKISIWAQHSKKEQRQRYDRGEVLCVCVCKWECSEWVEENGERSVTPLTNTHSHI